MFQVRKNLKIKVLPITLIVMVHYLQEKILQLSVVVTLGSRQPLTLVHHVTFLEFGAELKADDVLQSRLVSVSNVTVITNAQTTEITGEEKVNGLTYLDRSLGEERHIEIAGVFVQIGLIPNTEWLDGILERNRIGEIIVDTRGATTIPGVFAAGDCTDSAYNQPNYYFYGIWCYCCIRGV